MNLSYTVIRSATWKKLSIIVERDSTIVVKAPQGATDEAIERAVQSKRQWLFEKLHHTPKYQAIPHAPGKEIVDGESTLYLGREYRIALIPGEINQVTLDRSFEISFQSPAQGRKALQDWYWRQAQDVVLPRVGRFARELGVTVAEATIVDDGLRWGSCTPQSRVRLNWRLIKAPMVVIDYVVVHELAHLLEANHTPDFWSIVRAKVPGAEKAKAWLKAHGQLLETEI